MAECLDSYGLEFQKYFIFVGSIEPKKNLSGLMDGYAKAKARFPLLIVGSNGWLFEDDNRKINDERFLRYRLIDDVLAPRRQVQRLPYLPRHEMVHLMRGSRALLFPSLYEGFGLPVLEAMQLGVPVLTSNVASLKEIADDAAILVKPTDSNEIASGIRALDFDSDLRAALIQRGFERSKNFTAAKYHERIAAVYAAVS
jgi:glycosyltransferase involved in cell wall biosynthesis